MLVVATAEVIRSPKTMLEPLKTICERVLHRAIALDDDLFTAGLNVNRALNIVRLFWLESGIELDVNTFIEKRSLAAIVTMLAEGHTGPEGKALLLRAGEGEPLFTYAGGVNVFLELHDVVQSLAFDGPVYGLRLTSCEGERKEPARVEDEVRESICAIRAIQPHGPYRLLGYSFGGVVALEVARALEQSGEKVAFCGMVDTPQNDHAWPLRLWAGLMCRRAMRRLRSIGQRFARGRKPAAAPKATVIPPEAIARLSAPSKGRHIFFRFRDPHHPEYPYFAPQWIGGHAPAYAQLGSEILRLKGLFRPKAYAGRVVFFLAAQGSPVDCDARTIWSPYLPGAEWVPMKGSHLSILVGRNGKMLASEISARLAAPATSLPQ